MGKYLSLEQWYRKHQRVLPWRENPSLYRVWISEIMLQQTQVATVTPFFERFMARFPSVEILAQAPLEEVLTAWAGLGYYSRARNLHQAAREIVSMGDFPRTREGWLALPGVGPYTAGAIVSIALGLAEAILDGNVERVISRWHLVDRTGGDAAYKSRLWELSARAVREAQAQGVSPSIFNQALMELGALVCQPKRPSCALCPMKATCGAFLSERTGEFPPARAKKSWIQVHESAHLLINARGEILLRKRKPGQWHAGLWDLPLSDELELSAGLKATGQCMIRYVVTRHKIERKVRVWKVSSRDAWIKKLLTNRESWRFERLEAVLDRATSPVPAGSPLRKSLQAAISG